MKIQKFNENIRLNLQESEKVKMEIRTIPVEVEFDFLIRKYATGPDGDYYSVRVLLKDDFKDLLKNDDWFDAIKLGDYTLEKDIDNVINKYIGGISKEHRIAKKYNL